MSNHQFYKTVIFNLADNGSFEWKEVMAEIKGTKYEPKNWMDVRSALQEFINTGGIQRDNSDLNIERYI